MKKLEQIFSVIFWLIIVISISFVWTLTYLAIEKNQQVNTQKVLGTILLMILLMTLVHCFCELIKSFGQIFKPKPRLFVLRPSQTNDLFKPLDVLVEGTVEHDQILITEPVIFKGSRVLKYPFQEISNFGRARFVSAEEINEAGGIDEWRKKVIKEHRT